MKKVGIVTNQGKDNYGNRLQNYATEQILKSFGMKVETIIPDAEKNNLIDLIKKKIINFKKMSCKKKGHEFYKFLFNIAQGYVYKDVIKKRSEKFKYFSNKHLNEKKYNINNDIDKKFDFFIVGSDCIWSPREKTDFIFLRFANKNKRISLSPSFSHLEIPKKYEEDYKNGLSEIKHISVREESGVKIIKKLTNRNAERLLDPTMLIDKDKWKFLSKKSKNIPQVEYLLVYRVGTSMNKWNKLIKKIANKYNLKIIKLGEIKDKRFEEGPQEFLEYFKSAKVVFTDSFHGTIFSILFRKPFIVCEREGDLVYVFSKIDNLLKIFNFESRLAENVSEKDIFEIDFSHVEDILKKERKKSINYLKRALNIE